MATVAYEELRDQIARALENAGLSKEDALTCAEVHAQSSADGIESHGANRIPRFVSYVRKGWVDVHARPTLVARRGMAENYDGHMGIGVIGALACADRAIELAREHGMGLVTLRNATHWMRGGTYAWRMAEAGLLGICWTNTESCMPLWGSDEQSVGNNPFCIALPRKEGPVVLDMAMSQYSYGKLGALKLAGKRLPYPGGFDAEGNLTDDPGAIQACRRLLPMGYWKGSSMALALDMAAALLAGGNCGSDLDPSKTGSGGGTSQVFLAFDPTLFATEEEGQAMLDRRVNAAHGAHPAEPGGRVTYPGERTLETRRRSVREGVHVDDRVWEQIGTMAKGDLDVVDIA